MSRAARHMKRTFWQGGTLVAALLLVLVSALALQPLFPSGCNTVAGAQELEEITVVSGEAQLAEPLEAQSQDEGPQLGDGIEDEPAAELPAAVEPEQSPESSVDASAESATTTTAESTATAEPAAPAGSAQTTTQTTAQVDPEPVLELAILTQTMSGYTVTVEGALPQGARLELAGVDGKTVDSVLEAASMADATSVFAADITIVDAAGNVWQPSQLDVRVTIENLDLEDAEELSVVHVLDDVNAIAEAAGAEAAPAAATAVQDAALATALPMAAEAAQAATGEADTVYLATIDELTATATELSFAAGSFSVYVVVHGTIDAPAPPDPEIVPKGSWPEADKGYYLSYTSGTTKYVSNRVNKNNAYSETDTTGDASLWYFEATDEAAHQYRIYTMKNGVKDYMWNTSGNLMDLSDDITKAAVFELAYPETTGFTFKLVGENKWLQHSTSGGGFRLWTKNDNLANSRISLTYIGPTIVNPDHYGLDGETYSIVYHAESVEASGLTTTTKAIDNNGRLRAEELFVRPDVLNNQGELLIDNAADLPEWTFESAGEGHRGDEYRIKTVIGGRTYYLTLTGNNLTLEQTPTEASVITVTAGAGDYEGKYRFGVEGYSLTLTGSGTDSWFCSSNSGAAKSWLSLAYKSDQLSADDFHVYSAEKVNLADETQVHGATPAKEATETEPAEPAQEATQVIVYARVWNASSKKYEFYAVNYDGGLIRCYESGDMIQWVGSQVNTALWEFTEYFNTDGTPNFFYQLQSTYTDSCLYPQGTEVLRSAAAYPDYTTRSINLNGRRYGYYYSTILVWDDNTYSYTGLKANTQTGRIETCPMSEADVFYFAVMKPVEQEGEHATVETVDHTQYGITMKMVDLTNGETTGHNGYMSQFLGSNAYNQYQATKNLLSTNLDPETGYPTTTNTNKSLAEMYSTENGIKEVNHLFIKNTYFSSGYYEFDSTQNFASFYDAESGTWSDTDFTVYTDLATNDGSKKPTLQHGQFLPYNKLSDTYASLNQYNLYNALGTELPDADPRKGEPLLLVADRNGSTATSATDYFFAVEIEASFTQTANGHDAWGHDIIYEFTGDDDFWLYVDGELVIDLGGIHSALAGSVNYCTGEVVVNDNKTTLYNTFKANYKKRGGMTDAEITAKLAEIFEQKEDGSWVFKDYTTHTMRIFYMERGAGASNLHMRFNLASVKPGTVELSKEVEGVDDNESFMAEYAFQIYYRFEGGEEQRLVPSNADSVSVKYKDTERDVTYYRDFVASDEQTHYSDVYVLKPGETAVIEFPENTMEYRIVECYVNTEIYSEVWVNDEQVLEHKPQDEYVYVTPVEGDNNQSRKNFDTGYAAVKDRTRVTFTNKVDQIAKGTIVIKNRLFEEDGTTRIEYGSIGASVLFTYRLYLGTENTSSDNLPLADMHSYHVKDTSGNYCVWDSDAQAFSSLGKSSFEALTDQEKQAATFTTSMYGSISKIPVDYTVEVREIPAGTKYKVEERLYEIPDGYTLKRYLSGAEGNVTEDTENPKKPITGIISSVQNTQVEIENIKGWGLRAYKDWTDADYMESRDPLYLALYAGNTLADVEDAVHVLAFGETSQYWFIEHLAQGIDFADYNVREVTLEGDFAVDSDTGVVTGYAAVTPVDVGESGRLQLNGKQFGDTGTSLYAYTLVSYETGTLPDGSNVRVDTLTNKRAGVDIYVKNWDASEGLPGATFTLTDGHGNARAFVSDADGLVTIAYLRENETYTLAQAGTKPGYYGMQNTLTLSRVGSHIDVQGTDSSYFTWDDTDVTTGIDIRIGQVTVKNKPYDVKIKTTDSTTGNGLAGVKFALYRQVEGANGQMRKDYLPVTGFESLVTDATGSVPAIEEALASGTLRAGTYYLSQTEPLDAYKPLERDVAFEIGATGVVRLVSYPSGTTLTTVDDGSVVRDSIVIPNDRLETATLTVANTIQEGTTAGQSGDFSFAYTVVLYMPDGRTPWSYTDTNAGGVFTDGRASFSLAHNQHADIDVPLGAVVSVTQDVKVNYSTTYSVDGGDRMESYYLTQTISDDARVDFYNTRNTATVALKKTVAGNGGTFTFTVRLRDGERACEGYTIYSKGSNVVVTDANGEATLTLSPKKNGTVTQNLTVPYGAAVTIVETENPSYSTTVKINDKAAVAGFEATLSASDTQTGTVTVLFTNSEYGRNPPSGVKRVLLPALLGFGVGGFLAAGFMLSGRRLRRARQGGGAR